MFAVLSLALLLPYLNLFFSSVTAGGDVCAGTLQGCSGVFTCCSGIDVGICCNWTSTWGYAILFQNMPQNVTWWGRGYTDFCATLDTSINTPLAWICESRLGTRWVTGNWVVEAPAGAAAQRDVSAQECATPDILAFTIADGTHHRVKVPEGRTADDFAFETQDDFGELLKLEAVAD